MVFMKNFTNNVFGFFFVVFFFWLLLLLFCSFFGLLNFENLKCIYIVEHPSQQIICHVNIECLASTKWSLYVSCSRTKLYAGGGGHVPRPLSVKSDALQLAQHPP